MNWMQAYEILACAVLFLACISFNASMRGMPNMAKICTALLALSALVRGAGLIAKASGMSNLSKTTIAAADGNIPMLTAALLCVLVWRQIKFRTAENV